MGWSSGCLLNPKLLLVGFQSSEVMRTEACRENHDALVLDFRFLV